MVTITFGRVFAIMAGQGTYVSILPALMFAVWMEARLNLNPTVNACAVSAENWHTNHGIFTIVFVTLGLLYAKCQNYHYTT